LGIDLTDAKIDHDEKLKSVEDNISDLVCSISNPEDCEACGS
jgi:hypothetical protein